MENKTNAYKKQKEQSEELKHKVENLDKELKAVQLKREEYFNTYPDIKQRTEEFDVAEFSSDALQRVAACLLYTSRCV